jgi:hypothetical protein
MGIEKPVKRRYIQDMEQTFVDREDPKVLFQEWDEERINADMDGTNLREEHAGTV